MAVFRRGKWWWTDFSVNGQRYRQPLRTADWRTALAREKEQIAQAAAGKLAPSGQQFARLAFGEAADRYLVDRTPHLAAKSVQSERERIRRLKDFFGATPLTRANGDAIRQYIAHRKEKGISNRTVNLELGILGRVLKRAKRWHLVADELKPLPERRDIGRALAPEQKARLLKLAAGRPEWRTAFLAARLALNTTMRGCELKGLRWRDVDFIERTIAIQRSKTAAGERVIPLNADAWAAVLELRERALAWFGETRPDWFLFPRAEGYSRPDPTRPAEGWRTAWRSLTRAVECPACGLLQQPGESCRNEQCKADMRGAKSPLAGLRFHDLRHHSITELAESRASEQTILAIAGHVSPRMLAHYSHVRLEAKRTALDALSRGGFEGGYGTKNVTKDGAAGVPLPQAIENFGGADGTRTRDLLRDRQAF
jgi:integrase